MNVRPILVTTVACASTSSTALGVTAPPATMTNSACQISTNVSIIHVKTEHAKMAWDVLIASVILVLRVTCVTDRLTTVRTTHVSTRQRVIITWVTTSVSAHQAIKVSFSFIQLWGSIVKSFVTLREQLEDLHIENENHKI